jgi:hypothetical protein
MHFYFIFYWHVFELYLINHKFNLFMLQFYFFIISFFSLYFMMSTFYTVDILHCRRFTLSTFFFSRHLIFDIFLSTFSCRHFTVDIWLPNQRRAHIAASNYLLLIQGKMYVQNTKKYGFFSSFFCPIDRKNVFPRRKEKSTLKQFNPSHLEFRFLISSTVDTNIRSRWPFKLKS